MKSNTFQSGSAALLVDSHCLLKWWQLKSFFLNQNEFRYLYIVTDSCKENFTSRRRLSHYLYYILNIMCIRQKRLPLPKSIFENLIVRHLDAVHVKNNWFSFTPSSIDIIASDSPAFILKFGLGLLKTDLISSPILSYHHGNPSYFRGRPAGFYEILYRKKTIGQIIQILSNQLDSGSVLAFCESKTYLWSYSRTLRECYSLSPFLLKTAISNLRGSRILDFSSTGTNFRLPSNRLVILFMLQSVVELCRRYLYGLFYFKQWSIAALDFSLDHNNLANSWLIPAPEKIKDLIFSKPFGMLNLGKSKSAYQFYADPFILNNDVIFEGLNLSSGLGELLSLPLDQVNDSSVNPTKLHLGCQNHLSYPYTISRSGQSYIYPDTGSAPVPFVIKRNSLTGQVTTHYMQSFEEGLTDPSVLIHNDYYYLFANLARQPNVLRLWYSKSFDFCDAIEHECSPICISPFGGRMGGRVFVSENKIFRFGQNNSGSYGKSLLVFSIDNLTTTTYCETFVDEISFPFPISGPHTIDVNEKYICWDYYKLNFSPIAWLPRLKCYIKSITKLITK